MFGENTIKKKASFCGMDCLNEFLNILRQDKEDMLRKDMQQIEFNIRDHVHGEGDISSRIGGVFYGLPTSNATLDDPNALHEIPIETGFYDTSLFSIESSHVFAVNSVSRETSWILRGQQKRLITEKVDR